MNCEMHTPYCHGKCERYRVYAAEVEAVRSAEHKRKSDLSDASEVRRLAVIRAAKRIRRKKPCQKGGSRV